MSNPNPNTKGLISWKPGQSGNPKGDDGKPHISHKIRKVLKAGAPLVVELLKESKDALQNKMAVELEKLGVKEDGELALIMSLFLSAMGSKNPNAQIKAGELLLAYLNGKPKQPIQLDNGWEEFILALNATPNDINPQKE
jgi:hypothetical protein